MTESIKNDTSSTNPGNTVLQYLIRKPQVETGKNKGIILLHGVGSNEQDLFGLASQLPKKFFILSPRGQFTIAPGRYAWYHVDFSTGRPVYNKEQEASSREVITTFIDQVREKYKLAEIYLGGFSQGAIMSYSIGLLHPRKVTGVISLSGRLLEEIKPLIKKDNYLQDLRLFVAHGVHDNTLPVHYAKQAKEYLENLGVPLSYHEYSTGHQISNEVLQDLNQWLQ